MLMSHSVCGMLSTTLLPNDVFVIDSSILMEYS
jgi:hypothetical protein